MKRIVGALLALWLLVSGWAFAEEEITSVNELKTALSGLKSGDRVKVSFIRPDDDNAYRKDNVMSVMVTLQ